MANGNGVVAEWLGSSVTFAPSKCRSGVSLGSTVGGETPTTVPLRVAATTATTRRQSLRIGPANG